METNKQAEITSVGGVAVCTEDNMIDTVNSLFWGKGRVPSDGGL